MKKEPPPPKQKKTKQVNTRGLCQQKRRQQTESLLTVNWQTLSRGAVALESVSKQVVKNKTA